MQLDSLIRTVVGIGNTLSASVQVPVTHRRWLGDGVAGKPVYAAATDPTTTAIVKRERKLVRAEFSRSVDEYGLERYTVATVTFLSNFEIGSRDFLALADGTTGPIVSIASVDDPTGGGYTRQVVLGEP